MSPRIRSQALFRMCRAASLRVGAIAAAAPLLLCTACTELRMAVHNFADLDDHRIFANREIAAAAETSPLRSLRGAPAFVTELQFADERGETRRLDEYLDATRTAAFVVLHEDRLVYERYARGYDEHSLLNSFSIAKSVLSTLVAIALAEGRIASLDSTVASYRPEFASLPYGEASLRSLLTMTSGMGDRPSMLPDSARYYYGDDLHGLIQRARRDDRPDGAWRYSEADVQMLASVLEAAVGKSVSEYLAEKLWKPLGMESKALWALDRVDGTEKAFCCISARARDFARFGRLYLEGGRCNGRQIVPASWIERSELPGVRARDGYTHRHLWWMPEGGEGDFFAYGHNGQYVYVNPNARVVIVKFSETDRQDPVPMFRAVSRELAEPARAAEMDGLEIRSLALR